ncbi:2043_t:CDS:10, partial [Scutellospora calospora]
LKFPYVTKNLENFLNENWSDNEMKENIQMLREQAMKDVNEGLVGANLIPEETSTNVDEVKKSVIQNIKWQMSFDRKISALKSFQGYIWKSGFISGELKSIVYDDVIEAMNQWKDFGIKMYIYSSGSVAAQKLLFGHSNKGNLLEYFSGYFDTTIGSKLEKNSYLNIAKHIGVEPKDIVFLSDNFKEINAAKDAGFQTAIVERPNNAPLSDDDRNNNVCGIALKHLRKYHCSDDKLGNLPSPIIEKPNSLNVKKILALEIILYCAESDPDVLTNLGIVQLLTLLRHRSDNEQLVKLRILYGVLLLEDDSLIDYFLDPLIERICIERERARDPRLRPSFYNTQSKFDDNYDNIDTSWRVNNTMTPFFVDTQISKPKPYYKRDNQEGFVRAAVKLRELPDIEIK